VVGNVQPGEVVNSGDLLLEVTEAVAAAGAPDEMSIDGRALLGVQFVVEIAAQGEETAPHNAISR